MFKKISNIITSIFLVTSLLFLMFSVYTVYINKDSEDFFIFGYKPIYVLSGSMEPTLKTDSIAIVKKTNFEDIKKDDIIMFKKDDMIISHRVISINENRTISTKGDNNDVIDNFVVNENELKGKIVLSLNWVASIVSYCRKPYGIIKLLTYIVSLIIFVFSIKYLVKQLLKRKDDEHKKIEKGDIKDEKGN